MKTYDQLTLAERIKVHQIIFHDIIHRIETGKECIADKGVNLRIKMLLNQITNTSGSKSKDGGSVSSALLKEIVRNKTLNTFFEELVVCRAQKHAFVEASDPDPIRL